MDQLQRKRARRFANFLLTVPAKQFDMNTVCETKGQNVDASPIVGECGTVACAIGHLPVFNRFTYSWDSRFSDETYFNVEDKETGDEDYDVIAEKYFGFSQDEVEWLFNPGGYSEYVRVTPKTVAKRILGLLEKNPRTLSKFKKYIGE